MTWYSLLDQSGADSEDPNKPLDTVLRAQPHQLYDSHCAACVLERLCVCPQTSSWYSLSMTQLCLYAQRQGWRGQEAGDISGESAIPLQTFPQAEAQEKQKV